MIRNIVPFFLLVFLLMLARPSEAVAENARPVYDSIPANKPAEPVKEVPKSRKQVKPLAVIPIEVKPVLIKPKITVKPVIKIH